MSQGIQRNYYKPQYPKSPDWCPDCPVNVVYQTLPNADDPRYNPTYFRKTITGPTSMKHIYTGIPNYYPLIKKVEPVDTLYGHDYSQFHTGVPGGIANGKRMSYHYKLYPFTNRNVKEVREYADYMLPYMFPKEFTKYPVMRDQTVNSPLQTEPNAFWPDPYSRS